MEVHLLFASNMFASSTDTYCSSLEIMPSYIGMQQSQTAGQGDVSHKWYLVKSWAHRQPSDDSPKVNSFPTSHSEITLSVSHPGPLRYVCPLSKAPATFAMVRNRVVESSAMVTSRLWLSFKVCDG